jgi:GrpB-like predicted nucleotidyltransferase (UPF0157 family)
MPAVIVVDYDPSWPALFERIRASVWPAVHDLAAAIEHVGSTSVPGLAAKPIIDLDVVVRSTDHVPTAIARLAALGYQHLGDFGIAGREAFRPPPGSPDHHLYVCRPDSASLANHLAFRDQLRRRPELADAYGALKTRLATQFAHDLDAYVVAKTAFIVDVLREAGLPEDRLRQIERGNRRET